MDTTTSTQSFIRPPENLIVEGIPPIPESLAEITRGYTEFRQSIFMAWHPSERAMLVRRNTDTSPQLFLVRAPGALPQQCTAFEDMPDTVCYPPHSSTHFMFRMSAGGNEQFQYYLGSLETDAFTLLTDGISHNSDARWSNAGTTIAYVSNRRNGVDMDLYVADPADPATTRLVAEFDGGGWVLSDWSPDDREVIVMQWISNYESYLWVVEIETGARTLLTPRPSEGTIHYSAGGDFDHTGNGVFAATDRDSEFIYLVHIDRATGVERNLTGAMRWDVEEFVTSPNRRMMAFTTNEEGISRLHVVNTDTGETRSLSEIPTGIIQEIAWHSNNRDIGFSFSSARTPFDAFSVDSITGEVTRWTETQLNDIDVSSFSMPELIHWTSFDERRISGFLYRPGPRWPGRRPVIIDIHGGPAGQALPRFLSRYNYIIDELGIAFLYPNVRGSSGYGKTFLALDDGYRREDSHRDIDALLDWIAGQPDLDPERVMVMGGSYGGYMTLAVAVNYPERIRCAVDVVGISNFVTFLTNTAEYRRDLRRFEYGDERDPAMRAFLEQISPLNNAERITKPIMVVQGVNDPRVPVSEAEQMVARLRAIGTPVWYLAAKDEGHGFAKKSNVDFEFLAKLLFIEQYLI
ncbi:MAG: S9 family peptidase [Bacteroidetes bacterium]|nr:S9 family peptidase [Bacteroidota bacterium]